MSKFVVEISRDEDPEPIWEQRLRVTAYCRVSTEHEEQQYSLMNQIKFSQITSSKIPVGALSPYITTPAPA